MSDQAKPKDDLTTIVGVAGAAGYWLFTQYTGESAWRFIGSAVLLMVVFIETPLKPKWFLGAISATLAHVISLAADGATSGQWLAVIGDLLILFIFTVNLWIRPGFVSAFLLGLVQAASLAYNVYMITQVPFGDLHHKGLTANIVFRSIAISALVTGYLKFRRESVVKHPDPPLKSNDHDNSENKGE